MQCVWLPPGQLQEGKQHVDPLQQSHSLKPKHGDDGPTCVARAAGGRTARVATEKMTPVANARNLLRTNGVVSDARSDRATCSLRTGEPSSLCKFVGI